MVATLTRRANLPRGQSSRGIVATLRNMAAGQVYLEFTVSLREVKQRNSVQPRNCAIIKNDLQGVGLLKIEENM